MPRLLLVSHAPSPNTRLLERHIVGRLSAIDDLQLIWRAPLAAGPDDVLLADGVALLTTENLGTMAGRSKDFFERIYYPCRTRTEGLPVVAIVRAGEDGAGSVAQLERTVTGLRWRWAQPPEVLRGAWQAAFPARAAEIAETLGAGLAAGIF